MNRHLWNGLCIAILMQVFPIVGVAQLQRVESKSLRTSPYLAATSEIPGESRLRFHEFARSLPDQSLTPDAAKSAVINAGNTGVINLDNYTIEQVAIIVMHLVAEDAEADLKAQMAEMEALRKQRSAVREGNARMQQDRNKLAAEARLQAAVPTTQASQVAQHEIGASQTAESMSQRLKVHQDRYAKAMETLRKLMEAASSTESNVSGNIK